MNNTILNALKEQVLLDLEGNDEMMDAINAAVIRVFEANSIDVGTDAGFEALNDVATSFYLAHQ